MGLFAAPQGLLAPHLRKARRYLSIQAYSPAYKRKLLRTLGWMARLSLLIGLGNQASLLDT